MGQHLFAISTVFLQHHTREIEPTHIFRHIQATQAMQGHHQSQVLDFNLKATLEHNLLIKSNHSLLVLNLPVLHSVIM